MHEIHLHSSSFIRNMMSEFINFFQSCLKRKAWWDARNSDLYLFILLKSSLRWVGRPWLEWFGSMWMRRNVLRSRLYLNFLIPNKNPLNLSKNVITSCRNSFPTSYPHIQEKISSSYQFFMAHVFKAFTVFKAFFWYVCAPVPNKTLGGVCFCMTKKKKKIFRSFLLIIFFIQSTDITKRAYLYKHKRIHVDIKWLCRLYLSHRFTYPKNFFLCFILWKWILRKKKKRRKDEWMPEWRDYGWDS